ncbi:MAG: hypothetical protein N3A38_17060 [Planctomycetota bacterium]|nr:hypothetical protein [Planctomycetota bacterium]
MEFFELKTGNVGVRIRNTGSDPVALVVVTVVISRFSDNVERWGTISIGSGKGSDYPLLLVGGKSPPIISTMKQPDAYQSIWILPKGEANLVFCGMLGQSESFKNFIDGEKKLKVRACAFAVSADIYRGLDINSRAEVWSGEIAVEVENYKPRNRG